MLPILIVYLPIKFEKCQIYNDWQTANKHFLKGPKQASRYIIPSTHLPTYPNMRSKIEKQPTNIF